MLRRKGRDTTVCDAECTACWYVRGLNAPNKVNVGRFATLVALDDSSRNVGHVVAAITLTSDEELGLGKRGQHGKQLAQNAVHVLCNLMVRGC